MLPIHTILHPTDFSARSKSAFDLACALARDYDARLVVVHVKPPRMMGGEVYALITTPEEVDRELRGELDKLQPHDDSTQIERVLKEGDAGTEILRMAKEISSDVIVMGTRGRTGLSRLLMGSVAEAVSRKAHCPVLKVKLHPLKTNTFSRRTLGLTPNSRGKWLSYSRTRIALMWLALIGLFGSGCGSSELITIQGTGATFPEPLYKRWFREYYEIDPNVRVSYQGLGSGAGIRQFTAGLVEFGASDSAMNPEEIKQVPEWGVKFLPMTSGCIVLTYNLPGVSARIRLSREVYPKIFLGKITRWNDPAIARANPGVALPDLPITVVRRSDGSGTTFVLTKHLSAISPEWAGGPGEGKSVSWPTGIGSKGNSGVAFTIDQTPGAIGYLEYSYVLYSEAPTALLENKAGVFVKPSIDSARFALESVKMPANLVAWVPDPEGPDAYPIVSYSWILCRKVYDDPKVAETLKKVLLYAAGEGQKYSKDIGYVPLPEEVARRVRLAIATIEVTEKLSDAAAASE